MNFDELLIDRIYEAAVVPNLWKPVLHQIALGVNAAGLGLWLVPSSGDVSAVWSGGVDDICKKWIEGGWQAKTQRPARMMALNHAGFVADCDTYAPQELELDEAYTNFLRPAGFGHGAGTGITMPTGDLAIYSVERRYATGAFTRADCLKLDILRPHLARAALLCCRAGLERAQSMARTLETIGVPGAVLRRGGKMLAANDLFAQMMPAIIRDGRDRLHLSDTQADKLLASGLDALSKSSSHPGIGSFPIPADKTRPPLIVHLLPVRGVANDFFLNASAVVVVTPVNPGGVPAAEVLQGLFDLTPAEAKVAGGVGRASNIDSLAKSLGIQPATVRKQLKAVLAKTGVRRQSELVSLLTGKTYPRDRG